MRNLLLFFVKCGIIKTNKLGRKLVLYIVRTRSQIFLGGKDMLVSAKDMMNKARDGKYAVGQFNINNLEWTKAILNTAQKLESPVILGVSGGAGK